MKEIAARWTPPPAVRDHTGAAIPPDTVFFAAPPPEIGPVLTAHSGVRHGGSALEGPTAKKVIGLFALFGVLVGGFLGWACFGGSWPGLILGALAGGGIIGGLIYRRESRKLDCTYTGAAGIARYRYGGNPAGQHLLFTEAVELQTAFLGRNMGTNFNYQWKDARNKCLFQLEGGYYGSEQNPDPDSVYHFARAAEQAWTAYLLPKALAEMETKGSYRFITSRTLGQLQYSTIGRGYLELARGSEKVRLQAADIDSVVIHQGVIMIRRTGNQRDLHLSYGVVSNTRLFFFLLERFVGVPAPPDI